MVTLRRESRVVRNEQGELFYNAKLPTALRNAMAKAANGGYVATMPHIVKGRTDAELSDPVWANWLTANTEEGFGSDGAGKNIVFVSHGKGILPSNPARIEQAYAHEKGLSRYAARVEPSEIVALATGAIVPVVHISDYKKLSTAQIEQFDAEGNGAHAVILPFDAARATTSGSQAVDKLYDNDLVIARAGGTERAHAFLDKLKGANIKSYGQWHALEKADVAQPEARLLFAIINRDSGLFGDNDLDNYGRFVGVAPEARAREIVPPTLDQIMTFASQYIAPANQDAFRAGMEAHYK